MTSNCVVVFHFPLVCVLMSMSAAYVTIGSYISRVSTNNTFATVYKGIIDECRLSMSLRMLQSGCNYLK